MKRVSIFVIMLALIAGMVGCDPISPTPPLPSQNLEIRTWYDLDDVRDNLAGNHTLMNDLDSTTSGYTGLARSWEPIGTRSAPFTGSFNGQGYEICDLIIDRPDEETVGLFGIVDEGGRIENIGVVDADVTGFVSVGGLVGENEHGTVSNSYFTGSVTGYKDVGGLVGRSYYGTVSNSYSTGSLTGNEYVGGLVGRNWGYLSNSYYNYDEVLINGDNIITIGALFDEDFDQWLANDKFLDVNDRLSQENGYYVVNNVTDFKELLAFGQNDSLKFRLKNDLDLAAEPDFYIPYLAGEFDGNGHKISNLSLNFDFVYHVGLFGYLASGGKMTDLGVENVNITGVATVGGLVGTNWDGTVSSSYSTGSVTGTWSVGGLVGANHRPVTNSYSTGSVSGEHYVGGLVGENTNDVSNSYSTGSVTGTGSVGGLVGANLWDGTVSNSFWDTETSGQATSAGGTGKNTTEMKYITTFSGAGWNIIEVGGPGERNPAYIWNIVNEVTYPFLSWQPV